MATEPSQVKRVYGNKEVVDLFKQAWKEAKRGEWSHAAFVAIKFDEIGMARAGNINHLDQIHTGLLNFAGGVERVLKQRSKDSDPGEDAGLHEYNLACDPVNFDFLMWLIEAEMIRLENDVPGPLRIHFSHQESLSERGKPFFENVHRQLLRLIPAVETYDTGGWRKAMLTSGEIVRRCKIGQQVPRLHADLEAKTSVDRWLTGKPQAPVTITLREATHWPHRNSDLDTWLRFASYLKDRGEYVIFVRDTTKGNEHLTDKFDTYPAASFHVRIRMALYERAKINLFVSNGPAVMGIFSDKPYLCFHPVYKDEKFGANNPEWWPKFHGIEAGEQWPWAYQDQKMIWDHPTYENLVREYEKIQL